MFTHRALPVFVLALCATCPALFASGGNYRNFDVAVYCRVYEVRQMKDPAYLKNTWAAISKHVKVDKVYLETHRDTIVVDQVTLDAAKRFFEGKGVRIAGGITATINESNQFETYCYSNPEHRRTLQEIVEFTAKNFNEIILDDFSFTSCKCDLCIRAKGSRNWTRFRLEQMDEAGRNITSGLLKALQGRRIEDIVELEYTGRTVSTREFFGRGLNARSETDILIPEIRYATNDSWEVVSALTSPARTTGTPILHSARYSKGVLYVLTIPQAQGDLYSLPPDVLTAIRNVVCRDMYVRLEAPSQVSLFVYDNDTFIVESFRERSDMARIVTDRRIAKLRDLVTGRDLVGQPRGDRITFDVFVRPGTYSVFGAIK